MSILKVKLKNVFAKKMFLPFLFAAFFILSALCFNFCNFKFNKIYAEAEPQQQVTIPTEYCLFNIEQVLDNFSLENRANSSNYIKNVGTQSGTSICWAFAVNTALETTIYKKGLVSQTTPINFSELNMAYVSQVVNRGASSISGGTFDLAYEFLSSEYGPVYEQETEGYSLQSQSMWASDNSATLDYSNSYYTESGNVITGTNTSFYAKAQKSNFAVLEAVCFPEKRLLTTNEEKLALRNNIKEHIYTNGAVTASIYMDSQNLINNQTYICTQSTARQNHMITLVGWDDDYTITLGTETYTGAYIAQNSSGTDWGMEGYFYIMFDDVLVENDANAFSRVSLKLAETEKYNNLEDALCNNQFLTLNSGSTSYTIKTLAETEVFSIANIYKVKDVSNQYISRIKVPTSYNNKQTTFNVYVLPNIPENNVRTENAIKEYLSQNASSMVQVTNVYNEENPYLFTSNQATYYTIELPQTNRIYITSGYYAVVVKYLSGSVPNLTLASNLTLSPDKLTYCNSSFYADPTTWERYEYITTQGEVQKSILPMVVQTCYDLGTITYSADDVSKIYNAEPAQINVNVTTNCNPTIYYSLSGEEGSFSTEKPIIKDVGTHNVYYKIVATYYNVVANYLTINITPRQITLVPFEDFKTYGNPDPVLSFEWLNTCGETINYVGGLTRESGENVGTNYLISQGSLQLESTQTFNKNNYTIAFSNQEKYFSIKKRNLYVTPNLNTKTYGDADPSEYAFSVTNIVTGEIAGSEGALTIRDSGEDVGLYTIYQGSLTIVNRLAETSREKDFLISNYNVIFRDGENKFKIEPRPITVTPRLYQNKLYGSQDPTFTFDVSNVVAGEIPAFMGALARVGGEEPGHYNYLKGNLALTNNGTFKAVNYTITLNANERYFSITFGDLTGCSVQGAEVDYNGTEYTVSPICANFEDVSFKYSLNGLDYTSEPIRVKNANTYTIYVKFSKENYNDKVIPGTIIIRKLNLVVTPNSNQSKFYGDDDPTIIFAYTGNIEGETPVFTGSLFREVDSTPINGNDRVGSYTINIGNLELENNANFLAQNYNLVLAETPSQFTIYKKNIVITPTIGQTKYYNTPDYTITYTHSSATLGEEPLLTGELSREPGENVGNYNITLGSLQLNNNGLFSTENYELVISENAFCTILPAKIKIVVDDVSTCYGDPVVVNFTYECSNISAETGSYKTGDDLNLRFICPVTESSLKGIYEITCLYSNKNYDVTIVNGTYEIYYNTYTIQFSAYNKIITSATKSVEHFYILKPEDFPLVEVSTGYIFNSWLFLNNGTFTQVSSGYAVTQNITLTAFIKTEEYTITYNVGDGSFTPILTTYNIETPDFVLNNPTKAGYTFIGWYSNPNFEGNGIMAIPKGSTGNIALYAKYSINTYTISFNNDINLPYTLIYQGSTSIESKGTFKFNVMLKQEYSQSYNKIKVYARINNNPLIPEPEEDVTTPELNGEETIPTLMELTKNEQGYYTISNILANYEIYCENITLNSYNIYFIVDDVTIKHFKRVHGDSLYSFEMPEIPEKEHYNETPAYWSISNIEKITKDEVIIAKYVPNKHIVTFVMPDGKTYSVEANYGETAPIEILESNYHMGIFKHFVFNTSINEITEDKTIKVRIVNNAYILYIVLGVIATAVAIIVTLSVIKKRKKDTFNWWVYTQRK